MLTIRLVQSLFGGRLLAVGDEEGLVSIVNTTTPASGQLSMLPRPTAQWVAHRNAIFGLGWYQVQSNLFSGTKKSEQNPA